MFDSLLTRSLFFLSQRSDHSDTVASAISNEEAVDVRQESMQISRSGSDGKEVIISFRGNTFLAVATKSK